MSSAGQVKEQATIGASIVIKGDVSGSEPLFIDGTVEGAVNFAGQRVTVGRSSHIHADIHAQDVVVMGEVEGNIYCADLLDIRAESAIRGHLVAKRIRIDDGASLKGSVEVHSGKPAVETEKAAPAGETSAKGAESALAKAVEARAAREAAAGASGGRRVQGSSTLIEPGR